MSVALRDLEGARLRKLDSPWEGLFALELVRERARDVVLVAIDSRITAIARTAQRPKGRKAPGFVRFVRDLVEGARLARVTLEGGALLLELLRGEQRAWLVFEARGVRRNVLLLDAERRVSRTSKRDGALRAGDPYVAPPDAGRGLFELVDADVLLGSLESAKLDAARDVLSKALRAADAKLTRRLNAAMGDAARADGTVALRHEAAMVLAHLRSYDPRARLVEATDWASDPPITRHIAIPAPGDAKDHAEALYRRAKKLERGAGIALARAEEAERARTALARVAARVATATTLDALELLIAEATRLGVRDAQHAREAPESTAKAASRVPYRSFVASHDVLVLVGRGAKDNDDLTLHHARPSDLFLHARDRTGAHVIVRLPKGASCPPDVLADAATLAAHFSDARGELLVEITYAERRYVRKKRGAPIGSVSVERERVLVLRLEPDRLSRLLASELDRDV